MAYDEGLAQRVREEISELPGYTEKMMFGGVGISRRNNRLRALSTPSGTKIKLSRPDR